MAANIFSDVAGTAGANISSNGRHVVVEVDGYIFDNVHPYGVERSTWEQTLHTVRGNFEATFIKGKGALKILEEF